MFDARRVSEFLHEVQVWVDEDRKHAVLLDGTPMGEHYWGRVEMGEIMVDTLGTILAEM